MRPSYGFVIRAVHAEAPTVGSPSCWASPSSRPASSPTARAVPALRRGLLALIEGEGGLDAVAARRPRPPRSG
jgi:hypothetical protein